MKKTAAIPLILFLISFFPDCFAQNSEIDSLQEVINKYKGYDTVKVNMLNDAAYKIYSVDIDKTLKYAIEAGKIADELNYLKGSAESLRLIAVYYFITSDFPQAREYYNTALLINVKIGEKKGISNCLNGIGLIYYYQGNYPAALEYYRKALLINEEINETNGISNCLINIGLIHRTQGNYTQALENYQKALEIFEEADDKKGISSCLNNIGVLHDFQKNYPQALEYYRKALPIKEELGDKQGISACLINIGLIHSYQENYPQAVENFEEALKIREEIGDKKGISECFYNLGNIYLSTKNYTKSLDYTLKSLKVADELELLNNQKDIHDQLSELYALNNNYKKAYISQKLFKELNDSIFNAENIKKITALDYQYKYEKEKQAAKLIQQKKDAVFTEEVKRQKTVRNSFIIGFIFMVLFVLVVLKGLFQKRKANLILIVQKKKIEQKNEELNLQNEEIQQLNEELTSSNDQLYTQREELKTTLAKLKETQSQLVQSEKMASIGILTSGIAHEINNPLNFIQGGKFAIERYIKENIENHSSELLPLIEMIETGIERTTNIVKSLTRFSRTNESDTEKCDIHFIIDNSLVILKNKTDHKVEIVKKYTNVSNSVIGNEGRLHQAFLNLITNAIQAIHVKGTISITTNVEKEDLIVKISDTGSGISKENIKKITDPFFTTKDPGKGTGLGLSIAYNIIQEHKGSIEYKSKEGKGTTVTVTFPIFR